MLLKQAESSVNRWIAQSSAASELLRSLEGRSMRIDVDKTSWRFQLAVHDQRMRISSVTSETPADIVLQAGPFELIELLQVDSPTQLKAGEIEFRGSVRVAEQFARVLKLARPQIEDELAGWIGGLPARAVALSGKAAFDWSKEAGQAIELDTAEYLRSEVRVLPLPEDVADYLMAVERLRDDVDRLGQRVERLARTLK